MISVLVAILCKFKPRASQRNVLLLSERPEHINHLMWTRSLARKQVVSVQLFSMVAGTEAKRGRRGNGIAGGWGLCEHVQVADCQNGGQLVAATPGRLLDVVQSGPLDFHGRSRLM